MKEDFNKHDYDVGSLAIYQDLTDNELELLIKLLPKDLSKVISLIFNIFGTDQGLEFLDIFADERISLPSRKRLYKLIEKIKIYVFIKSKKESDDAYKLLAKQLDKRISQLHQIVSKIDETLNL